MLPFISTAFAVTCAQYLGSGSETIPAIDFGARAKHVVYLEPLCVVTSALFGV